MMPLIDNYFSEFNVFLPLLHRPTFETSVLDGLHFRDNGFAGTLLLVCACGAIYSDDPRVRLEGVESQFSRGWKWHNQVPVIREYFYERPTLYELQQYAVRTCTL